VEMAIRPAEGDLQHLVENVESDVGPHVQTSPNWRLGVLQIDTHAEDCSLLSARFPE
jgi:hypothetical protein